MMTAPSWRAAPASAANGPIIISEVAAWSSGNSPIAADWFEVTNTGSSAIDITGWKIDDNSNAFASAANLTGITSIAAGESVIFIETADPAKPAAFRTLWFGASAPAGLQIGTYTGAGLGLSTGGDAVNLYDGSGVLQANVGFGGSTLAAPFATFNNAVGLNGTTISQLSVAGVNGAFAAANDTNEVGSPGTVGRLFISEVAPWSSGNSPVAADWFEVTNTSSRAVDITGWRMDDNSNAFANSVALLGITSIAPGESVIFIETANPAGTAATFRAVWFGANPPAGLQVGTYTGAGVGLSTAGDAVNLYAGAGVLQANAAFGASPVSAPFGTFNNALGLNNDTIAQVNVAGAGGAFLAAGDPNEVGSPGILGAQTPFTPTATVKINEVESSWGVPGDWVELFNTGATAVDLSGYQLKDSSAANTYVLPAGSIIAAGGYLVLDELVAAAGNFNFPLDAADSARLFAPGGVTLIDTYAWLEHSATSYGRCPNGTGAFVSTLSPTRAAANACPAYLAWPGDPAVATVDAANTFGENLSGLVYEPSGSATPGVLWAVRNGPETLFRLAWDGLSSGPDTADGWGSGKQLRYPGGAGQPDSEGVTFAGTGPAGGIYVATERNNAASATSRPSILRFDAAAAGAELTATAEWNLTADLPPLGANLGLEGITWIPDAFLVSRGFFDESRGQAYDPSQYPGHGNGLFFVAVEANGFLYAYALDHSGGGGFTRIATIDSGFPSLMEVQFDRELQQLWAVCDNTCEGRTHRLGVDSATGKFMTVERFDRPAGMPNLNNEGFATGSQAECVNGRKPAYWTDDGQTDGHAIRRGSLDCDDDADNDGATNAAEVGAGGAPPNTRGSDPNDASSTPEVCDGLDNDLNEGIDEGFVDTDNDGARDCVDADDDNDGFSDAAEAASAGTPPGNTTGSDPRNAASRPEACDGLDNDLNEGTDEGFLDTDSDGAKDCVDSDDDNDRVPDATDNCPLLRGAASNGGCPNACTGPVPTGYNVINGTNRADRITGTPGNDVIYGRDGEDTITGNGGDDIICAGDGNDRVTTGAGNDVVSGGDGNDTIDAGGGDNAIDAHDGNDRIQAGDGNDWIVTGDGNDEVQAGGGNNTIDAGEGNDRVQSGAGNDTITTGEGNDNVQAGDGDNVATTGAGNDVVVTGAGADRISAGSGNDTVDGGAGFDICNAGSGNNQVSNCEA